jgi:hypothetical protein
MMQEKTIAFNPAQKWKLLLAIHSEQEMNIQIRLPWSKCTSRGQFMSSKVCIRTGETFILSFNKSAC